MKSAQGLGSPPATGAGFAAQRSWGVRLWQRHGLEASPGFIFSINIVVSSKDGASQAHEHHLGLHECFAAQVPRISRGSWFPEASATHFSHTGWCFFKREASKGSRKRGRVVRHWTYTQKQTKRIIKCFFTTLPKPRAQAFSVAPPEASGQGTELRIWQGAFLVPLHHQRY